MSIVATVLFGVAVLHTFFVKRFSKWANRFPQGSWQKNLLRLLGEVEIVFGLWAAVYVLILGFATSFAEAIKYLASRSYTEPLFVFVIIVSCATSPVLGLATKLMEALASAFARVLTVFGMRVENASRDLILFAVITTIGPLLGSLITEPAAMAVCALMLLDRFYTRTDSLRFKYAMTGLLFVNISIGGTLTSFAAPPVLMVAKTWNWDSMYMLTTFGWKAVLACFVSTGLTAWIYRKELMSLRPMEPTSKKIAVPMWLTILHLVLITLIVLTAHRAAVFIGVFLVFLGAAAITEKYQDKLRLKEGLLVAFFLLGLVVLGGPQEWWIAGLLEKFQGFLLFAGAAGLTAVTDNAALTYLGSLVTGLSDESKYALVAGAVTGGGLTVIANAPNPAGVGILNASFGESGMSPIGLLKASLLPTAVAAASFWLL